MQSFNPNTEIGLWVPCEGHNRFLDSLSGIELLLALLDKHKITDVFVQVFRGGRAWFPSKIFENGTPDSKLQDLLAALQHRGIRAHAWINVCNAGSLPSQSYLELLGGGEALLRDGRGRDSRSNLNPFEIDTPGVWLEPSNPAFLSVVKSLTVELNKLSFSGVHLDFIRYPYTIPLKPASWIDCGIDFGYSELALKNFNESQENENNFSFSNINGLIPSSEKLGQAFDAWRRSQIEILVRTFKQALATDRILSVAALAWSDRAYLNAYQDWRYWLESNLIDSLCLMSYTADTNLFSEQIKQAKTFLLPQQSLFAGIGLYKLGSMSELASQLKTLSKLAVNPCYFCADRLLLQPFDH